MRCEDCGFEFDDVGASELASRLRAITERYAERLMGHEARVLDATAAAGAWSAREYGAHVHDVLFNLRDRVLLALLEESPTFAPIHREERVHAARYSEEPATLIGAAIAMGGELLAFLFERLDGEELSRRGLYAGVERDVLWIGRQALHEATHHLLDVDRCLRQ